MYRKIDHIAIAVRSLQSACRIYADLLGLGSWTVEEIADQRVRVAVLPIGESRVELLEATADDSPIAGFLSRRGEGLHHICFEVEDLAGELEKLKAY
jgi:methylmalonyl-CoA/ethylmalonyl-CoA epimerase